MSLPVAVTYARGELIGPRILAVAVSVTYVIRSILDVVGLAGPPANHPYAVPSLNAARRSLLKLNGPRTLAVAVSVAYVIRSIVDTKPPPLGA